MKRIQLPGNVAWTARRSHNTRERRKEDERSAGSAKSARSAFCRCSPFACAPERGNAPAAHTAHACRAGPSASSHRLTTSRPPRPSCRSRVSCAWSPRAATRSSRGSRRRNSAIRFGRNAFAAVTSRLSRRTGRDRQARAGRVRCRSAGSGRTYGWPIPARDAAPACRGGSPTHLGRMQPPMPTRMRPPRERGRGGATCARGMQALRTCRAVDPPPSTG